MVSGKYLYKINLDTSADVAEFVRTVCKINGDVHILSGSKRLNAKSIFGVLYAKVAWNDIYVESNKDCWWELRRFIEE